MNIQEAFNKYGEALNLENFIKKQINDLLMTDEGIRQSKEILKEVKETKRQMRKQIVVTKDNVDRILNTN